MKRTYFVYILANPHNTVLYTGVTSDLEQRVFEHKTKAFAGFTSKYNCNKLVYFEEFDDIEEAIKREKQVKRYHRKWKEKLIEGKNPKWEDISEGWFDPKSIELGIQISKEEQ